MKGAEFSTHRGDLGNQTLLTNGNHVPSIICAVAPPAAGQSLIASTLAVVCEKNEWVGERKGEQGREEMDEDREMERKAAENREQLVEMKSVHWCVSFIEQLRPRVTSWVFPRVTVLRLK